MENNNIADVINNYINNGLSVTHVNLKENDQGSKSLSFPKNWLNRLVNNNIEEWYGNVAIATGHGNHDNICVIDIDSPSHSGRSHANGFHSIKEWKEKHGEFPETLTCATPTGGIHLYYRVPPEINVKKRSGVLPGVDIIGDKGCVIAPPSSYEKGSYVWKNLCKIADANSSILALMQLEHTKNSNSSFQFSTGSRHNDFISLIGKLKTKGGLSDKDIENIVRGINNGLRDPLLEKEFESNVLSAIPRFSRSEKKNETMTVPSISAINGVQLSEMKIKPLEWLVEGILPLSGLAILVGDPKSYKSYMAMDLCISVASGKPFLGHNTFQHDTLYFDLESGFRRPKDRQAKILNGDSPTTHFHIITAEDQVVKLGNGLEEQLKEILTNNPKIKLIVIDTLEKIREIKTPKGNAYQNDVAALDIFLKIATEYNVCFLFVHHLKKRNGVKNENYFEYISGSNGIFGSMDTTWQVMKKRMTTDGNLYTTGREIEEKEYHINFDLNSWKWNIVDDDLVYKQNETDNFLANSITKTILRIMENNDSWSGTASDLIQESKEGNDVISTNAQQVSRFINTHLSSFSEKKISFSYKKSNDKKIITISKI